MYVSLGAFVNFTPLIVCILTFSSAKQQLRGAFQQLYRKLSPLSTTWAVLKLESYLHQDIFLRKEKVRRYRARFCRCRILLGCFYQELHSGYTPPWGSGFLFGWLFCYSGSGSKPSPQCHSTVRFCTNTSWANDSNYWHWLQDWEFGDFSGVCCYL